MSFLKGIYPSQRTHMQYAQHVSVREAGAKGVS